MDVQNGKNDKNWWQPVFILFFKWSVWIVVPILLGAFVGKWLDGHYKTEPFLFLISTGVAFLGSIGYLVREAGREYKKLDVPRHSREGGNPGATEKDSTDQGKI